MRTRPPYTTDSPPASRRWKFLQPDGSETAHMIVAFHKVWKPQDYPDHQLPLAEIEDEITELILRFPNLVSFKFDEGSYATMQNVRNRVRGKSSAKIAKYSRSTKDRSDYRGVDAEKKDRAEMVTEALALRLVHVPRDDSGPGGSCLLFEEMKYLELRDGTRVVTQSSEPVTTGDAYDAFSRTLVTAMLAIYGNDWRERLSKIHLAAGPPMGRSAIGPAVGSPPASRFRQQIANFSAANQLARGIRLYTNPYGRQGLKRPPLP